MIKWALGIFGVMVGLTAWKRISGARLRANPLLDQRRAHMGPHRVQ